MQKTQRSCRACGGEMRSVRQDYQFKESGLDNVILKDIEVLVCDPCGSIVPRIPRLNDLMRTIAVAMIAKPSELTGPEVRFLRKFMDETIEGFARKLGVDRSHLSRIENESLGISRQTDRLVRALALIHRTELLEKLARLGRTESVLMQLEEIEPEATRFRIDVAAKSTHEYSYTLEPMAA
ncbi:MAG TPA: YgiT-type zinc finger protein [Terracidiphilus sp.]|nr:YgiT-type zinc finger protein [Terracidiphilus sp.]